MKLKLDHFASAILLVGTFLNIQKSWVSFLLFMIANLMYFVYWHKKKEWATMILVGVFLLQDIYGLITWLK